MFWKKSGRTVNMGNKLKKVFSKEEISYGGKINFSNQESYENFMMALETVQEEGGSVRVKGVDSVETLIRKGNSEYLINENNKIYDLVVAPSTDEVSFELDTACGKKMLIFNRYLINKGVVLQTSQNAIIFLKIFLEKDSMKSNISYQIHLEKAKTIKELTEGYYIVLSFFNLLFRDDIKRLENGIDIKSIKMYFVKSIEAYKKLEYVEKEFGVTFVPKVLTQNEDSWMDLEELYLALKEKEVIRLNAKVNDTETTGMKINQQIDDIKVGSAIDITFITKIYYSLWDVKITLFSANLLSNAIIKEINESSDGEIKILYGSEDSRPMYISYMGFKTEEEAKEEMKEIMNHKADYLNALTVLGYINKRKSKENDYINNELE